MFVVIADISLKKEKQEDFKKWFENSNKILSNLEGFISRRLLESEQGINRIIVEHQSRETFEKMHKSPEHAKLHSEAIGFMEVPPQHNFYEVIAK